MLFQRAHVTNDVASRTTVQNPQVWLANRHGGSLFEEDVCGTSEARRLCPARAGIFAAGS